MSRSPEKYDQVVDEITNKLVGAKKEEIGAILGEFLARIETGTYNELGHQMEECPKCGDLRDPKGDCECCSFIESPDSEKTIPDQYTEIATTKFPRVKHFGPVTIKHLVKDSKNTNEIEVVEKPQD